MTLTDAELRLTTRDQLAEWARGAWYGQPGREQTMEMASRLIALEDALREINLHLQDVVETRKNGDSNNWNGYYLPLFERLSARYSELLPTPPKEQP